MSTTTGLTDAEREAREWLNDMAMEGGGGLGPSALAETARDALDALADRRSQQSTRFDDWAIVELMGHRRLAGRVQETRLGGADVLRIDVPAGDGFTTQFYGGSALYCLTPTTESVARQIAAAGATPEPVHRWELPERAAVDADADDDLDPEF